jgi:uncharacterized membrane protein YGL010W
METKMTDHSLVSLLRDLRDETTTLVRQEIALAKAETTEKAAKLSRNAVFIGAGAALAYAGLILLLLGFRDWLANCLSAAGTNPIVAICLSSFIIGVIIGLIGWGLIAKGKKALANEGLTPKKTLESLREDQQFIKQKLART